MSNPKVLSGNIFTSGCHTLVNTVNCVGVMGAGLALECRLRYPSMYAQYSKLCNDNKIDIGLLWIYKSEDRWILNFPTKKHWKYPTKEEYLHAGLEKFVVTYQARQIKSIAFPLLGAQHGGLSEDRSLAIMMSYLKECDIPIEIYRYDPSAPDDAYLFFKAKFLSMEDNSIRNATGLRSDYIKRIRDAMGDTSICQLNRLASVKGIGDKTLEKAYAFVRDTRQGLNGNQAQLGL